MTQDLFSLYHKLCDQKVFFAFKGAVSQGVLVELGGVLKSKLVLDRNVKKVFSVFIELTQNILHYSAEKERIDETGEEVGVGIIVITETSKFYVVSSGNKTLKDRAEDLKAQCEFINSASEEELKRHHAERRKATPHEGSKGAGLGLIDMARKSKRPLDFTISPIDEEYVFFILNISIEKGE